MKIKEIIFLAASFLLFFSCNNKTGLEQKQGVHSAQRSVVDGDNENIPKSTAPVVIDIARDFKNKRELRLSEIAEDIEYVKLEKTPESIVGGGNPRWYITKDYIFVFSHTSPLQFDRDGKFIRQIGRYGRGPGEFQAPRGVVLDEKNNILYIIANFKHQILKYDVVTGEFLGDFPVREEIGGLGSQTIHMIRQDTFIVLADPFFGFNPNYFLYQIIDNNGNVLTERKSYLYSSQDDKNVRRIPNGRNQIWFFNKQFRFYEGLTDTIYKVENNTLEPVYILELGKYKGSFEEMTTKYYNEIYGYLMLSSFWETQKYVFFRFTYNGMLECGIFDKTEGTFYQLTTSNDEQYKFHKIINDIDGGLPFWPALLVEHNDKEWINCFNAIDLKQQLSNEYLETSEAKYPEKKERLKKFMDELSIDDNPVLMVVKLKD